MNRGKTFVVYLIFAAFLVGTIFSTIEVSSWGGRLVELMETGAGLIEENESLNLSLVKSSSLNVLSESAESMGYKKAETIVYLTGQGQVADANTH